MSKVCVVHDKGPWEEKAGKRHDTTSFLTDQQLPDGTTP